MITAHIAGIPLEETLAAGAPALLTMLGAALAQLRACRAARGRPQIEAVTAAADPQPPYGGTS